MIDLHVHTTASDGTCPPGDVVAMAADIGLGTLAITDHDTADGVEEALRAGRRLGVEVIPGVELSVRRPEGGPAHVLGLYVDPCHAAMTAAVAAARRAREARNHQILARLSRSGMALSPQDVAAFTSGGPVGRPHIARALVARGHYATEDEAFRQALGEGRWAYVSRQRPDPAEAFRWLAASGGLAVLAHPRQLGWKNRRLRRQLAQWKQQGLVGLEVDHPTHTIDQRDRYREMALEAGLVATGGSDFHGPDVRRARRLGHGAGGLPIADDLLPQPPAR